jgi:YbgC/YbaW family acyl-CoA thioester hydrolase
VSEPFRTRRRVEFGDTDMAGIVHFANFFRFMEAAETEFLNSLGFSVAWRDGDDRLGLPRVSASCDFKSPARFQDVLDIAVIVEEVGRKSVRYRFDFARGETAIAIGHITAVYCRNVPGKPLQSLEIPDAMRQKLQGAT